MGEIEPKVFTFGTNCGLCNQPLVYTTESVVQTCALCGKEEKTVVHCPEGHYACESCRGKAALGVLRRILSTTRSEDAASILEEVMTHPEVPVCGPVHHAIVAGAVVAAVRNTGYPLPDGALEEALERAGKTPEGGCGYFGICGAALGAGIAASLVTGATPLSAKPRKLALTATSYASSCLLDDQPRCCLRSSRIAVAAATDFLRDFLAIPLPRPKKIRCVHLLQNPQCAEEACPFFVGLGSSEKSGSYEG